jgi:hypothetical protein
MTYENLTQVYYRFLTGGLRSIMFNTTQPVLEFKLLIAQEQNTAPEYVRVFWPSELDDDKPLMYYNLHVDRGPITIVLGIPRKP